MEKKEPRFFGRRHSKYIRDPRKKLLEEFLPKISVTLNTCHLEQPPRHPELVSGSIKRIDPKSLFPKHPGFKECWLEVGFGGGEHLAEQSKLHPNIAFIGSEVFESGIASLLAHLTGTHKIGDLNSTAKIAEDRADNVRLFAEDVRLLLPYLTDGSFTRIFVLFPDPWPKTRHAERRFIGEENLPELSRLLQKGGILRVASDDMNYIDWSLNQLSQRTDFKLSTYSQNNRFERPANWIPTRYEIKALKQGKSPAYLDFIKI